VSYLDFEKQRELNQKEISDLFSQNNNNSIIVVESPTGSGKTRIGLMSAVKYKKKYFSSVIISTNSNKNALEIKNTFLKGLENIFSDCSANDIVIEIGKSNYIDLELLCETLIKFPKLLEKETSISTIKEKYLLDEKNDLLRNDVLIEDFIKEMNLTSIDARIISSFAQDTDKTINYKDITTIFDAIMKNKIIIVNHSYLFVLFTIYGNRHASKEFKQLLYNTPIILDEFHSFFDSAKTILTKKFSLFRLKYSIDGVLKHIEEDNNLTHIKRLKNMSLLVTNCQNKLLKVESRDVAIKEISILKTEINNITNIQKTSDKFDKIVNITNNPDLEKFIRLLKTELSELGYISFKNEKSLNVSFSPKGYPTIVLRNKFPSYEMNKKFWLKREAKTLCLSGTLRTGESTLSESYSWVIKRNGLMKTNEDELLTYFEKRKDIDEDDIRLILNNYNRFNELIDNITYKTYNSLFPKEHFLYTIVDNKNLRVPIYRKNEEYNENISKWRKNIGTFIANNVQFNTLVLSTSYEDVICIKETIECLRDDIKIFYATEDENMNQIVENFKKSVDNGFLSCLIGTEQYYTGLDLKGDYLQEMYLAKIPFSPIKNAIGKKIIKGFDVSKDENYANEISIKFTQGIGRPIRDYKDKAIMYILDGRINAIKNQNFIKVVNKKAIHLDYLKLNSQVKLNLIQKETTFSTNLYTLFFSYFVTKDYKEIEQILLINKENKIEIDSAIRKILNENINIEKVMDEEYFLDLIKTKKYGNIWVLLLKIYAVGMKKIHNIDIEKRIIENNSYGLNNIVDISKHILTS
jgi:Rad3-related DNA helicase